MVQHLARPHGKLLCQETAFEKDFSQGGPPYGAALWCYQLHLTYPGNDRVIDYVKGVIDLSPETTSTSGPGLTQYVRFRTADLDTGGERDVETWMSIWGPALGGVRLQTMRETPPNDRIVGTTLGTIIENNTTKRKFRIKVQTAEARDDG